MITWPNRDPIRVDPSVKDPILVQHFEDAPIHSYHIYLLPFRIHGTTGMSTYMNG